MAPLQPQPRRKGGGTRTWLVVTSFGSSHLEEVGKHMIMRRTGLPARDLRILDPVLSYPSTVLGREKAIVVNLEHIKAVITATEVLVMNSQNPSVAPFVRDLEGRVSSVDGTKPSDVLTEVGEKGKDETSSFPHLSESPENLKKFSENSHVLLERNSSKAKQSVPNPMALPFEFKALEACLESTCRCLELETSTLEQEAYPALDDLSSKISTLNLQRVRQIKNRLVALSGRVQKVRDELENLLDDDMDMAEMYLTDKLDRQQFEDVASKDEANNDGFELDDERDEDSESNKSSSGNITSFKPKIEELEMLLEAYFAQIEGTLNKLSTLREYVDDTEDYINIILDDKQNQLLQMGVLLSTATLLLNAGIVVVGLFGMNISIPLFDAKPRKFWETTFSTVGGCVALYFIAVYWGKRTGLLGL